MKVSVIILVWNSARKIEACLASLPAGLTVSHEVIVVDNGSRDRTVAVLRNRFPPGADYCESEKPGGCTRAESRHPVRARRIHPHPG